MNINKTDVVINHIDYKKYPPLFEQEFVDLFKSFRTISDNWTIVIWTWEQWDKFKQLMHHAHLFLAHWFELPPTLCLCDDVFERFHHINALFGWFLERISYPERERRFLEGKIDQQLEILIRELVTYFSSYDALYIRSSAVWDATWNGLWESMPVKNDYASVAHESNMYLQVMWPHKLIY